jgi:hypothetical protein
MDIANQSPMPDWMKQLIDSDGEEVDRSILVFVLNCITAKANDGAWDEIDTALKNAPVATLSSTALMTVLRGTFRFQVKLEAWNGFRDAVAVEFERRGLNVSRLLMGLLPASKVK